MRLNINDILYKGEFIQNVLNEDLPSVTQAEYRFKGKSFLLSVEEFKH